MTLDELTSAFCEAMAAERDGQWRAGDVLLRALSVNAQAAPSAEAAKAKRGTLFKAFATAAGCSPARCRQLAMLSAEVEPGLRDPTRSWSWHRVVVNLAHTTGKPVAEVLMDASVNGWGARELAAQGGPREVVGWHGECGGCGFRVSVSCRKPGIKAMAGNEVACPVCRASLGRLG